LIKTVTPVAKYMAKELHVAAIGDVESISIDRSFLYYIKT